MEPRRSWIELLKPNLAGFILWLIILACNGLLFASAGGSSVIGGKEAGTSESYQAFGFPETVRISRSEGPEQVSSKTTTSHWPALLFVLSASYAMAIALGRFAKDRCLPGIGARMAITIVIAIAVGFGGAAWTSKSIWNYAFDRPARLLGPSQVGIIESLTPLATKDGRFEIDRDYDIATKAKGDPSEGGYYNLDQRFLMMLDGAGKLPSARNTLNAEKLTRYRDALNRCGVLVPSSPGYDSAKSLRGICSEFNDGHGSDLVFFGLRGGQVSNDHYPYYEILFDRTAGGDLKLIESQMFYFDVAGMEGMEWQGFFLIYALLGVPASLVLLGGLEYYLARRSASRKVAVLGSVSNGA